MADNTSIEWTDATWNPIRARNRETGKVGWFCTHASAGCVNCYAEGINHRLGTGVAFKAQNAGLVEVFAGDAMLTQPLRWKRPRKIFVCSMTDLFGDFVTDEMIDRVFAVMALCPQHTFQVLTKRAERMRAWFARMNSSQVGREHETCICPEILDDALADLTCTHGGVLDETPWPLPNLWLGVSAEDQTRADERIPILLDTPAAKRFVSLEPLLGPIKIGAYLDGCHECGGGCGTRLADYPDIERCEGCDEEFGPEISEGCPKCAGELEPVCPDCGHYMVHQHPDTVNLDWVIVGGESGPKARPMHPDWARRIRDDCAAAGVAFQFKQWGEWAPGENVAAGGRAVHAAHWFEEPTFDESGKGPPPDLYRVGKRAAGRTLDGVTHDGFPDQKEIAA